MHEIAMAGEIITELIRLAQANNLARVTSARVSLGAATCLQADSLRFGLALLAKGTIAQDAEFRIDPVPVQASCRHCGWSEKVYSVSDPACPKCGIAPFHFEKGRELILQTIQGEE
jgi:hydrogenase nickel incorporation protein HypA/HybF